MSDAKRFVWTLDDLREDLARWEQELRNTTNADGQPVLLEVLQTEVMRFADSYAITVAQAVDNYIAGTTNADAQLEIHIKEREEGTPSQASPLFNGRVGDGHFSAIGSEALRIYVRFFGECLAVAQRDAARVSS